MCFVLLTPLESTQVGEDLLTKLERNILCVTSKYLNCAIFKAWIARQLFITQLIYPTKSWTNKNLLGHTQINQLKMIPN